MFESIAAGLLLGLSSGIQCTVVCLPVLLTQLMSKKRTTTDALKVSFLFSLGRLLVYFATSYVLFISSRAIERPLPEPLSRVSSTLLLGAVMVYYSQGALRRKGASSCGVHSEGKHVYIPFTPYAVEIRQGRNGAPLVLGVISSLSLCLPIVAVLSFSGSSDLLTASAAIIAFWVGSSIYSIGVSLAFAGALHMKTRGPLVQRIGFIGVLSSGLLGVAYLTMGLSSLFVT
jgi:hypothetical protein